MPQTRRVGARRRYRRLDSRRLGIGKRILLAVPMRRGVADVELLERLGVFEVEPAGQHGLAGRAVVKQVLGEFVGQKGKQIGNRLLGNP